ncbi:amidohydrolase family protein, partial [Chloroflexota bacterium]
MGYAKGRFVIDTHVHAQRHALGWKKRGIKPDYVTLSKGMLDSVPYDNSPRLLYDMERYGVDMCILLQGPGMTDELNAEIIKEHPDKFVGMCGGSAYTLRVRRGEVEWSITELCKELDEKLSTGLFVGIGEGMPANPNRDINHPPSWEERFEEICHIMEVAQKHKVTVGYHTGGMSGYGGGRRPLGSRVYGEGNPLLAHDIAAAYPDVPLIMVHGGMDGWWSEMLMDPVLNVAASHANVYLETGEWWAELYEKPLRDTNIGCEKLLWGTDWGTAHPMQWWPGGYPTTYFDQSRKEGIPAHL